MFDARPACRRRRRKQASASPVGEQLGAGARLHLGLGGHAAQHGQRRSCTARLPRPKTLCALRWLHAPTPTGACHLSESLSRASARRRGLVSPLARARDRAAGPQPRRGLQKEMREQGVPKAPVPTRWSRRTQSAAADVAPRAHDACGSEWDRRQYEPGTQRAFWAPPAPPTAAVGRQCLVKRRPGPRQLQVGRAATATAQATLPIAASSSTQQTRIGCPAVGLHLLRAVRVRSAPQCCAWSAGLCSRADHFETGPATAASDHVSPHQSQCRHRCQRRPPIGAKWSPATRLSCSPPRRVPWHPHDQMTMTRSARFRRCGCG